MATLKIKNKFEVSFRKLIKESATDGGIPDVIEVNGREGWEILNEIRLVGSGGFEIELTGHYDPNFLLKSTKERLDKETATDLVTRWWKGEFKVVFKHQKDKIPVNVVNESPSPKPKGPPNQIIKGGEVVDKPDDSGDNGDSEK